MSTDHSAVVTTTTSYSSAKRIKWETELLAKAEGMLLAERFATTKVVGRGEAGTVRLNKLLRIAKKTTVDSEGTVYGITDSKKLSTNYLDVVPKEFGDSFTFSDDVGIEAFITDPDNQSEIANQFARSMEYQVQKEIALYGLRHRIDNDATYSVSGTCDSGSSATALKDSALTQIDDHWNGGRVTITNPEGPGYDETSGITDFTASSDTADVIFTNALTTGSKYKMVVGTGIVAGDKLTTAGLLLVRLLHRKLETQPFENGMLRAFISPEQEFDLWDDTVWKTSAQYDDSGRYSNYQLIRWLGHEFYIGSETYREDEDGTENQSTGIVRIAPVFGQKAYSVYRWGMGQGAFGVEWHYKDKADSGDLRNKVKAISWKSKFAVKVVRSTSIVNLMTGATDANLLTM